MRARLARMVSVPSSRFVSSIVIVPRSVPSIEILNARECFSTTAGSSRGSSPNAQEPWLIQASSQRRGHVKMWKRIEQRIKRMTTARERDSDGGLGRGRQHTSPGQCTQEEFCSVGGVVFWDRFPIGRVSSSENERGDRTRKARPPTQFSLHFKNIRRSSVQLSE